MLGECGRLVGSAWRSGVGQAAENALLSVSPSALSQNLQDVTSRSWRPWWASTPTAPVRFWKPVRDKPQNRTGCYWEEADVVLPVLPFLRTAGLTEPSSLELSCHRRRNKRLWSRCFRETTESFPSKRPDVLLLLFKMNTLTDLISASICCGHAL